MLEKLFANFSKASLSFLFKGQENSSSCCTMEVVPLTRCGATHHHRLAHYLLASKGLHVLIGL